MTFPIHELDETGKGDAQALATAMADDLLDIAKRHILAVVAKRLAHAGVEQANDISLDFGLSLIRSFHFDNARADLVEAFRDTLGRAAVASGNPNHPLRAEWPSFEHGRASRRG